MKNLSTYLTLTAVLAGAAAHGQLLITGIGDGPQSGGLPKFLEIYVQSDIADLSTWDVQNYNNGGTTAGNTFALSGSATAGQFLYVASEEPGFSSFFGFAPNFTSGALNVNGDDVLLLRNNASGVDVFGVIGVDGTGEPWEYLDGWAYRMDSSIAASSVFDPAAFTYSGVNGFEGGLTNGTVTNPFPVGTYSPVPEPSTYAFLLGALGLALVIVRRRRA